MKPNLKEAKTQVAIVLLLISTLAILGRPQALVIIHFIIALGSAITFDLTFAKLQQKPLHFFSSSIVTGLLAALILEPNRLPGIILVVTGAATVSKMIFKIGPKHIFNPAAFGLIIGQLLFGPVITWWGIAGNQLSISIVLIGLGLILYKLKSFFMPLGFMLVYSLYLYVLGGQLSITQILDPTTILFAWVMLTEYKTSPYIGHWRFTFGIFVGLLVVITGFLNVSLDPLLFSLLIADLLAQLFLKAKTLAK